MLVLTLYVQISHAVSAENKQVLVIQKRIYEISGVPLVLKYNDTSVIVSSVFHSPFQNYVAKIIIMELCSA